MSYLKIQNKGELDVRLISLMGGSTKTGNTVKIGKFGTGLKYSLSWLIRNNIDFKIFIGTREVKIDVKKEIIQETEFDVIYIDGERSSITSNMGVDWSGWMICRELWCNALDEGDATNNIVSEIYVKEGYTTFFIKNTGEIKDTVDNWKNYFITEAPIYKCQNYALYPPQDTLCIYKQGVLIHKEKTFKSVFSYDIKTANINELREYKGYLSGDLFSIIRSLPTEVVKTFLKNLKKECFEYDMDYDWGSVFNESWGEAIGESKLISDKDYSSFVSRGIPLDKESCIIVPDGMFKKLSENFSHLAAVKVPEKHISFIEREDFFLRNMINEALEFLKTSNYEVSSDLSWSIGMFGDSNIVSKRGDETVMVSMELGKKKEKDVLHMIIKENELYKTGFEDNTPTFQKHLLNLYIEQIMNKEEDKVKNKIKKLEEA